MISSWDDLRHLEALERLGSAGAAGRELGVAASTVYRRIAALEQSVGFTCLVRGKGVTPAGRELAELARCTGTSLRGIAQRAKEQREEARGSVTLTTVDGFAPLLMAPLAELSASYPSLRVHVHISDAGLSLRKNQAELGLSLVQTPPSTLIGRKLFPIRFGVYGTATHVDAPERARWVVLGPPLEGSWLGRWENQHVPSGKIAAATASRRLFVDLVAAGVGIGLVPAPLAELRSELVELTSYRPLTAGLERPAWLLFPPELRQDVRVSTVAKVVAKHLTRSTAATSR
ncbi:LysR family transcriptional regulator [Polyangium spumosum]|uniref:LysR family transcriptional regulator n=1 Tax=Polyangium spumosum TaxID=889282 RepID=A0A6N7PY57_9BACT|nr:LysR family transcriptional regulator [Polyangium spumosum]MRG97122.1 LysR family transcriptional regulator [Polyangium spumosum]